MAVREVLDLPGVWQRIDALDGKVGGEAQLDLYEVTRRLVNEQTAWFLRRGAAMGDLSAAIMRHKQGFAALAGALESVLPPRRKSELAREAGRLAKGGVPADLAGDVARLEVLAQAPAITEIAHATGEPVPETARIFFEIGERLGIEDLARRGAAIATADQYDRRAIAQVLDQLAAVQAAFTREAIGAGGAQAWFASRCDRLARARQMADDMAGEGGLSLSRLMVAAAAFNDLAAAAR
jgi:glutamate dehydrogenase